MYETVHDDGESMVVIPAYKTKTCPQCGQGLFDDMDVCFGCLYRYPHEDEGQAIGGQEGEEEHLTTKSSPAWEQTADKEGEGEFWYEQEMVPTEAYGDVANGPDPSMGILIVTPDIEVVVPLPSHGLLVGRGGSCDVVLRSRVVSRKHVRLEPDGEGVLVTDQGATNPAQVGGTPVKGSVHVSTGDVVDVCGTTLRLRR